MDFVIVVLCLAILLDGMICSVCNKMGFRQQAFQTSIVTIQYQRLQLNHVNVTHYPYTLYHEFVIFVILMSLNQIVKTTDFENGGILVFQCNIHNS